MIRISPNDIEYKENNSDGIRHLVDCLSLHSTRKDFHLISNKTNLSFKMDCKSLSMMNNELYQNIYVMNRRMGEK